jgi:hypothetical protein
VPSSRNTYRCSIERNHSQRYEVRLEARYGRPDWALRVFFLATTPERVLARVPAALRFLHRNQEKLWLWGADPSDRSLLFQDLLDSAGFRLDRRRQFPASAVVVTARAEQALTPLALAEFKRKLAARLASVEQTGRKAAALAHSA